MLEKGKHTQLREQTKFWKEEKQLGADRVLFKGEPAPSFLYICVSLTQLSLL